MAISLTIDEGNSSVKLAAWDGESIIRATRCDRLCDDTLSGIIQSGEAVDSVIYSSVAGGANKDVIVDSLPQTSCVRLICLSAGTSLPIKIQYASASTLGADRIAAAAGAYKIAAGNPTLIVDAGTAVTYDFLSADGIFLGGNIAPGIDLRLRSLNEFTSALPHVDSHGKTPFLGKTTVEAMRAGAVRGIAAEIEYYHNHLLVDHPRLITIITGGSAADIAQFISTPFIMEPDLIMIGLKHILDYNENN